MSDKFSALRSSLPPMEFSSGEGKAQWLRAKEHGEVDIFTRDTLDLAERWARMIQNDLLPPKGRLAHFMLFIRSVLGRSAPRSFSDVDVWELLEEVDEYGLYVNAYRFEGVVQLLGKCWKHGSELLELCEATNFRRPS